jgi:hypothetical protein
MASLSSERLFFKKTAQFFTMKIAEMLVLNVQAAHFFCSYFYWIAVNHCCTGTGRASS